MRLYSYWRSSAAYRVRIALHLKNIPYEVVSVNLLEGAQNEAAHQARNAMRSVPVLELESGEFLSQSLAIIEYLDMKHPTPPLLSDDPLMRARILAATHIVTADIHPVNNLRVVKKLGNEFGAQAEAKLQWMRHFMRVGFEGFSSAIAPAGKYAFGEDISLADIVLVAQLYNARRWELDLAPFERLVEIEQNCLALTAFEEARPENQKDAQ